MSRPIRTAILSAIAFLLACTVSSAQTPQTARGTVTDASGEPVIGATIIIKGTLKGTSTDVNGSFTLSQVNPGDILQVSSIGGGGRLRCPEESERYRRSEHGGR